MVGRKKGSIVTPDHLRRDRVTVRLPRWLKDWLSSQGSQGRVVEDALVKQYKLKPPKK